MPTTHNEKIKKVMEEFYEGKLYSGRNKDHKVTSQSQALAIALAEQRRYDKRNGYHVYKVRSYKL